MNDNTMGRLPLKFVVPLTDWKSHYARYLWMVKIVESEANGLTKDSAADTFQAKSCSEARLIERLGLLGSVEYEDVAAALTLRIGFECP